MFGAFSRVDTARCPSSRKLHRQRICAKNTAAKQTLAVQNTRHIGKSDLKLNTATPQVDKPETYEVRADGELLTCQPAETVPMAQAISYIETAHVSNRSIIANRSAIRGHTPVL